MGQRTMISVLLTAMILIPMIDGSSALEIVLDEDSYVLLDLHDKGFFPNDTIYSLEIETEWSGLLVEIEGQSINISGSPDVHGEGLLHISNSTETLELAVVVNSMQDDPVIRGLEIEGDPADLENPVNATVDVFDPDGDVLTVTWYLNGEPVSEGAYFQRYVYPGKKNLSVVVDDGQGGTDEKWIEISTRPPPGWGDEPDNTRNRIIFWLIFGSGGLMIAGTVFWLWRKRPPDSLSERNG